MNQISFTCSNNHPFKVPAKFAGKRAKCPKCGEVVTIPQVSTLNTTSKIIPSNDALETCGFTDGLSPLAASVANSYTEKRLKQAPANITDDKDWQLLMWILSPVAVLIGITALALVLTGANPVVGGFILAVGICLFVKPAVGVAMLAGGVVLCFVMCAFMFVSENAWILSILVGVILLLLLVGFVALLVDNPKARWPAFACVCFFVFCFTAYSFYDRFDRHARIAALDRKIEDKSRQIRDTIDRIGGRRYRR